MTYYINHLVNNKIIFINLFYVICLCNCSLIEREQKTVTVSPSIVGVYVDTIIDNKKVTITYMSDTSVVIGLQAGEQHSKFMIAKSQMPDWFDINGYKTEKSELHIDQGEKIDLDVKLLFIADSLLIFPVFDSTELLNLVFLKIDKNWQLNFYDPEHPFLLYKNSNENYHRIFIDKSRKKFATKLFYPFMQEDYIVTVSTPFAFGNNSTKTFSIKEKECPMDFATGVYQNDMKKILKCVSHIIF